MTEVKRHYDSSRRRARAAETRQRLIDSARQLFAERGYVATTVEAIAKNAGSAPATFYKALGTKHAALIALLDAMPTWVDLEGLDRAVAATEEPREQLALIVDFRVRLYTSAYDILETVRAAAPTDEAVAEVWRTGESRRRRSHATLVKEWHSSGALKEGLTIRAADDILWALSGPDTYRLFISEAGWSVDEYRRWLIETLSRQLLRS